MLVTYLFHHLLYYTEIDGQVQQCSYQALSGEVVTAEACVRGTHSNLLNHLLGLQKLLDHTSVPVYHNYKQLQP